MPTVQDQSLANYGRPKIDGELKIASVERRSKTDRWVELTWTKAEEVVGGPVLRWKVVQRQTSLG